MTDLVLPGIIGGPCLPVGLALAAFVPSFALLGGFLVVCGVVLLAKGGV
jgi:hypothetical protein